MKLYTVQVAPNPTKVELYIEEKRALGASIEVDRVIVKLMQGEQNEPPHRARSPFATLPVLEISGRGYLTESLPIIEYLEELTSGNKNAMSMWGSDPFERAKNRDLERIADTRVLSPVGRYIHATKSPLGLPPNVNIADAAAEQIPQGLSFFDDLLSDGRAFLAGDTPTVADCTLAAALQFARFGAYEVDSGLSALLRWDQKFRARRSSQKVLLV